MSDHIWNVLIEKSYVDLSFRFDSADDAAAFASAAAESYWPDDDKFSVSVRAVFAEDVKAEKGEEE